MAALGVSVLTGCGNSKSDSADNSNPKVAEESKDSKTEDKVAGKDEMTTAQDVVDDSMKPISGDKIKDGTYSIDVASSSSMFKIVSCELTVKEGKMTAVMTMSGKGYLKLYMGTGEEAVAASDDDCIPFVENENGEHTFTVPVEELDKAVDCTAFSKNKEKWYDRHILTLKTLYHRFSENKNIIFTGFVQGKELEELYSNAYIYCLPSDLEGMPLSLLEAMSYGNCCLVSDIDECASVVEDKALVFEKSNVEQLKERLQEACNKPEMVAGYKKAAADFICEKYSWDDVVEKTMELYRG